VYPQTFSGPWLSKDPSLGMFAYRPPNIGKEMEQEWQSILQSSSGAYFGLFAGSKSSPVYHAIPTLVSTGLGPKAVGGAASKSPGSPPEKMRAAPSIVQGQVKHNKTSKNPAKCLPESINLMGPNSTLAGITQEIVDA